MMSNVLANKSLMPFKTGDVVAEVVGKLGSGGSQVLTAIVHHDELNCTTKTGNVYTRDTGRCIDKIDTYRALHSPDYEK